MPYVTVRVEVGGERLAGREVSHLEVRQAVGAHAHPALAFAPTPAMRAAPDAAFRGHELTASLDAGPPRTPLYVTYNRRAPQRGLTGTFENRP